MLRTVIAMPTSGRRTILPEALAHVRRQTLQPVCTVVSYNKREDVAGIETSATLMIIPSEPGSVAQRNSILDAIAQSEAIADCDIVLFLDDDFLMSDDYIAATQATFTAHPEILVTTGRVIADGIGGPGLSVEAGRILLDEAPAYVGAEIEPALNGYGCNMAVRMSVIRDGAIRFDERLPFYGWFEDLDFTRRAGAGGRIVKLNSATGVHLGTKTGRGSGLRLGFSQVINPLYLARKGSCPPIKAISFVLRNCAMNAFKSIRPEPFVDRRGRLRGNLIGLTHALRGSLKPEHVLRL